MMDSSTASSSSPSSEENSATMETRPTAKALLNRLDGNISQLLQRFENIVATATVNNSSHTATAVETYQLDVESTALIRAAEDILAMTRMMKELWLFGKLDTLGEDERDVQRREKLEEDVRVVQRAIDGGLLMPSSEEQGSSEH